MGRSQLKYSLTHGRGRGRGSGADTRKEREEPSEKWKPRHLRNVGTNGSRYEEKRDEDGQAAAPFERTQFFASEAKYRETMGPAAGEYFQSRVMKQWEETEDDSGGGVLTDIPYRPQDEKDDIVTTQRQSSGIPTATTATTQSRSSPGDDELDLLLNLSVSGSSQVKSTSPAESIIAPVIPTQIEAETEQLEDWLDDVLDMKQ
ncbi:hypothetical protein PsorP6_014240 [Peronosclerospora sorghi]|uniref:Uncharacterized protein n=1 Tax=Peronosclerospora sorghi TaxID=230839 RepID=A0ACC0VGC8_9STRA|nr:hypothetical protein PsorP6_014240 [Peronosclerospora sorghi]